ncbi:RNA polymerase sigma-54 factor [Aurantiacibacter atlanticus]|uniref:RNA polymerase sigma-54 factor n=1 Tax=Aurantiacibacter atlanticus TaxID=1648404 RepID=A0A0H4V9J7_9SPHN|nr:RNA polymerase factor sigma-54 [Aurantiacibacter atlanticus]AKQ41267.1 RNA polymerase sigma-54 factor [Aurantiacibacter atlanticus]MDF1835566.1 RNA polymerase factor sigma-54 [Alteraurantiacibacter sp. bin_em_oilr2.035]
MALGPRLDLRQSQSLVMTPQLQQAIKLLALSNLEVETFIAEALESNPLLETGEAHAVDAQTPPAEEPQLRDATSAEGDRALDIDQSALDQDRDTGDWSAQMSGGGGEDGPDLENRGAQNLSLADHLEQQVSPASPDGQAAFIARYIVGLLDEAGYISTPLAEVAQALGVPLIKAERGLEVVQSLDPTGVGARTLAECLALQAKEADRYDPCMEVMIDNLDLVAKGAFAHIKRICGVDDEDLAEMLAELRSYDPKPGLQFGGSVSAAVVPDILIARGKDNGWDIQLNEATLPRLVVNRSYYIELRNGCPGKKARGWLSEKLADANWLIKAMDQRQKTILKTAAEIVKQQDGFFRKGVSQLRPLTLKTVAEAIEMHESTVSRVTSNKFLACDRGTFELKYFFTSGVGGGEGGEGASAEAVKARIKALTDAENPKKVLSDDALVELLKSEGFDLARRTVAKYREAIGIGSSVQRRRAKKLAALG